MSEKFKVGRPRKNPELGRRVSVMFRLNEATCERLVEAGSAEGRSMSEEIERRIMQSFEEPMLCERVADAVVARLGR